MKRMPAAFYDAVENLRTDVGISEYDRNDLLPGIMGLYRTHGATEQDLLREAANNLLDSIEKAEANAGVGTGDLFPLQSHVALGERRRIRRGRMNIEQVRRRKRVIDHNKIAQDKAWGQETDWLNTATDLLEGRALQTVVEEVLAAPPLTASA